MKAHWKYLCYVVRHKWFVFCYGLSLRVPLWQLIIHDWSKFLPSEWFPYVDYFYGGPWVAANHGDQRLYIGERYTQPWVDRRFNEAWNRHQKRQPHHWQFWLLTMDSGETVPLEMPERYVREMVADWMGAGRAINGYSSRGTVSHWYSMNQDNMQLHSSTRERVSLLINNELR